MRVSTSAATLALALLTSLLVAACGGGDASGPSATATVAGVVSATTGGVVAGAAVTIGGASATTGADGRFEIRNLPVGSATLTTSAPGFDARSETVSLVAGANAHDVVLVRQPTATVAGVVRAASGAVVQGAAVKIGSVTVTSGADGRFEIQNVPVASATISASAPGFAPWSGSLSLTAGDNAHDVVLTPVGEWGTRAGLLVANSEFAFAEANGRIYALGGYPSTGQSSRTVQVYDIATNAWQLGPQLPEPNNHGMAASVNGLIYLIGGQTTNDQDGATAVNRVYELDPGRGSWVEKAPMPTARSGGVAVALGGKIYVAGGRVPRGHDFAVYDPAADQWEVLPELPSQRNHVAGAAINGRIHIVGGRLGNGLSPFKSDAHEVFDPQTRTWTAAAPMLRGRSGMNGVVARGCFHVWGGEAPPPIGMIPDHDYYDPRTDAWSSLPNMPIPIHGVVGSAFVNELIWVTGGGTAIGGGSGSLHNQTYRPVVSCE